MTTLNPHPAPLARKLQQLYLLYLGLLPALATFAVLAIYGTRAPFLIFLGRGHANRFRAHPAG